MANSNEEAQTKVKEQNDRDSMDAVLQPGPSVNMGDLVVDLKSSPRSSEHREAVDFDFVVGVQGTERRETGVRVDPDTSVCDPGLIKSSTRLSEHGEDHGCGSLTVKKETTTKESGTRGEPETSEHMCNPERNKSSTRLCHYGKVTDLGSVAVDKEPEGKETVEKTGPDQIMDMCNPDIVYSSTRASKHGQDGNVDSVVIEKETEVKLESETFVEYNPEMIDSSTRSSQHGDDLIFGSVTVKKEMERKENATIVDQEMVDICRPEMNKPSIKLHHHSGDSDVVSDTVEKEIGSKVEPGALVNLDYPEGDLKCSSRFAGQGEDDNIGFTEKEMEKKIEAREEAEESFNIDKMEIVPRPSPRLSELVDDGEFCSVEEKTERKTEDKRKPEESADIGDLEIEPKPSPKLAKHVEDVDFVSVEEKNERKTEDKAKSDESVDMDDLEVEPKPSPKLSEHAEEVDFGSVEDKNERKTEDKGEAQESTDMGDPEIEPKPSPKHSEHVEEVDFGSVEEKTEAKMKQAELVDMCDTGIVPEPSSRLSEHVDDVHFSSVDESTEAKLKPEEPVDIDEPEIEPKPSKQEHDVDFSSVAVKKETERKESGTKVEQEPSMDLVDSEQVKSSLKVECGKNIDKENMSKVVHTVDPSFSPECLPATDTISSGVFVGSDGPSCASESDRNCTEVKPEPEPSLKEESVDCTDMSLEEKPLRPVEKVDLDMDSNLDINPEKDKPCPGSTLIESAANDLDELMDIGTVDQMEQEAQMKEEGTNILMDVDSNSSSAVSNTVPEVSTSAAEDTDMKPSATPHVLEEDPVEDMKTSVEAQPTSLSSSEATAGAGGEDETAASGGKGMKIVKLSATALDTDTVEPVKACVTPPLVKVKDEPMDDEYDQSLISSVPTASVKDEPHPAREDLKIGSVYSVTSTETLSSPQNFNPPPSHMTCSHCGRSLTKGQTAFQRKGSPGLFCSATCLSMSLPPAKASTKICHYCQKMILRPQDVISSPDAKGVMKEFCSQNCLSTFNYKRNASGKITIPSLAPKSVCSMCTRYCISKHEVILNSTVHKICSDTCFTRFRAVNRLSMASCANCSSYCHKNPLMLKLEDCNKTLCNAECVTKFKEKTKTPQPCTMCRTSRNISDMVDNKNSDDSVNLFCSSSCVMAFKVQTVSASGVRLNCDNCGKNTVPSYHLAMSDTSIRNFCTLPCVMAFQEKFKKNPNQSNIFTKLPVESTPIQTTTQPDVSKGHAKLNCSQCSCSITFKPELIQIKDKVVFVCSVACSQEYKKANNVVSLCEYCKIEKITKETKRINSRICSFCSDGCKLLFRHDLTKSWGKHCHACAYCLCVSQKLVTAHYGGTTEEFCCDECRSKYTMLFCHVAKCDTCGQKGKLKQSLPMLGEVKHFCDLNCLLQFCSNTVLTQGEVISKDGMEDTPVIANVVSLASPTTENPNTSDIIHQRAAWIEDTVPNLQKKTTEHANIQRDPPPKVLKNKALMCRPLVQNKGVSCRTQTVDIESQTDEVLPKLLVMPIPVPVYVPVPMAMFSQCTPKAVSLPLPLPVPMFLPVTLNSAERIVETIQQIKEKIPSDPFEAELILMAEMVAEDDETKKEAEKKLKDRGLEKGRAGEEVTAPDEHASNYSDDMDTEVDLASFLNTWDDPSSETGLRSPNQPYSHEKVPPGLEVSAGMPGQPYSELTPPAPPPMDIEAEFTVDTLEKMAKIKEQLRRSPSPPPAPARRPRQAQRKAREKRGRKPRLTKAAEVPSQRGVTKKPASDDLLKLKSLYGIDAWKRWIQWRESQPNQAKPRIGSRPIELKEDLLRCTTAELSYGLCCFINEVKRPNGEMYSPDSLFYLCLGIQKYLFENGRVENIFMDRFYNKFSTEFTVKLKNFQPSVTASGYIHSRVEEDFLWDCKQLGAYSPIVLLNTLLFFCCKYFGFTTVEQHRQLSFAHVMRCTKTNPDNSKTTFLRFYPPIAINEDLHQDPNCVPAKKRREDDGSDDILEMMENTDNPLRCPVRLYEFYLSKCSESVKQRTNVFYLHPERSCVPNSPLWFSSSALDDSTMEAMLIRILTVREVRVTMHKAEKGAKVQQVVSDPPFTPDREEEEDSE